MTDSTSSNKEFVDVLESGRRLTKAITLTVILALVAFVIAVAVEAPANSPDFFQFMGRFHPMILHFPIGFLLGLFLIEVYAFFRPSHQLEPAAWIFLLMGALSATAACVLGLFLSWGSKYNPELLSDHKWMGFSVAGLALVTLAFKWHYRRNPKKSLLNGYRCSLILCILLLNMAGHHGGSLTHGSTYLTKYMPNWMASILMIDQPKVVVDQSLYSKEIQPLLEKNCYSCHGDDKQESDLRLDQPHKFSTLTGESEALTIVAGDAMASLMIKVITLPRDHEEAMPPDDKEPLTDSEVMKLIQWINTGALTPTTVAVAKDKKKKKATGDFALKVWPIFKKRCITCHGPKTKKKKKNPKGGLRLDTPEWIKKGVVEEDEDDTAVIVANKSDESSLYKLIILDEDDDDIMPAKGKPLTKKEQKIIKDWIDAGASYKGWVAEDSIKEDANKDDGETKKGSSLHNLLPSQLDQLRESGALVLYASQESRNLTVNYLSVKDKVKNEDLALLIPLKQHVVWVNLASSKISTAGIKHLAGLKNLEYLNLSNTKISDADLELLKDLKNLTYLNLYGTNISDAGLASLKNLPQLKKLFLWQSKVSEAGAKKLKMELKNTVINLGNNITLKPPVLHVAVKKTTPQKTQIATVAGEKKKVSLKYDLLPIFKKRCVSCHGPKTKKKKKNPKGGLRLDSAEWVKRGVVEEGEEDAPIFVAGKPDESSLFKLTTLDEEDDDIMPAKGKPLTRHQVALIKRWIEEGASFKEVAGAGHEHKAVKIKPQLIDLIAKNVPPAPAAALKALRDLGALAQPLAENNHLVQVNFKSIKKKTNDATLDKLSALSGQLTWLDLSGSQITDAGVAKLKGFTKLNRLNLSNTKITNAALAHLTRLQNLEYLNLYGCKAVSDAGLVHLKGLKNLKKLFVWQSKVSKKGAMALRKSLPEIKINLGAVSFAETLLKIARQRNPLNLALGSKATSPDGLAKDGGAGGDLAAIDGNENTFWDEVDGKKLYRLLIELPKIEKMSYITITGYKQHDYSPKDLDILIDGKVVKSVKNLTYTNNKAGIEFPTTSGKTLELKITAAHPKASASPAIRELEIYAKAPPKPKVIAATKFSPFFDKGSCCDKAHKKSKVCSHPCCVKAAKANTVCAKCNAKGAAKFLASTKLPDLSKFFDAGSCCDKAHKKKGVCAHPCCVKAAKAKDVCAKCNATGAAKFKLQKKK